MAKVKIQGHASGTGILTVTAPNTSTDRTITLPDATATLATKENFLSTGIDDNASAVKLTVSDSGINVNGAVTSTVIKEVDAGNVGISVVPESDWNAVWKCVQVGNSAFASTTNNDQMSLSQNAKLTTTSSNSGNKYIETGTACQYVQEGGIHRFKTAASGSADAAITYTETLQITADGRGLSQFTAKAWCNFNGTGTIAFRDSHNCSSLTDISTGRYTVNFTNNMGNSDFAAVANGWNTNAAPNLANVNGMSTSSVNIGTADYGLHLHGGNYYDYAEICLTVFGD
jgi:hypothetical protein